MSTLKNRISLCVALLGAVASSDVQAQWTQLSLSQARPAIAAVSVDGKLIIAGGVDGSSLSDLVEIYDEATDTWSYSALSSPRAGTTATAVGDYAIFAGGQEADFSYSAVVDILHVPDMIWTSFTLTQPRTSMGATTVGNKAIFAGGKAGIPSAFVLSAVVDIYDADLGDPHESAAWTTAMLSQERRSPAATSVGGRALFAGGLGISKTSKRVDIFNDATGIWSTAVLSEKRLLGTQSAVSFGTRAYFAGGFVTTSGLPYVISDLVDIYDSQTGVWTTETLSVPRGGAAAVALGNKILFAGGWTAPAAPTDVVDIFDAGTGLWDPTTTLSQARGAIQRAAVNGKGFFAGGSDGLATTAVVDVYTPIVSSPWTGLGYALPGVNGDPTLLGSGPLTTGSAGSLNLSNAAGPGTLAILFISLANTPTPFKGGTLAAVPFLAQFSFGTTGSPGSIVLPWASWPAGLSGTSFYFQYGIQDGAAVQGAALSNLLRADVP